MIGRQSSTHPLSPRRRFQILDPIAQLLILHAQLFTLSFGFLGLSFIDFDLDLGEFRVLIDRLLSDVCKLIEG